MCKSHSLPFTSKYTQTAAHLLVNSTQYNFLTIRNHYRKWKVYLCTHTLKHTKKNLVLLVTSVYEILEIQEQI